MFVQEKDQLCLNLMDYPGQLDMNQLQGIQTRSEFVPMSQYVFDDEDLLKYDISQLVNLKVYLSSIMRSGESSKYSGYTAIIRQVVEMFLIGDKLFYASPNNILFNLEHIYVELGSQKLKFIYLPFSSPFVKSDNRSTFRSLVESFYPFLGDSSDALVLQSKVMQFLSQGESDLKILKKRLEQWEIGFDGDVKPIIQEKDRGETSASVAEVSDEGYGKSIQSKTTIKKVKKLKSQVLLSIVVTQVILLAVIGVLLLSGIFVDAESNTLDSTKLIAVSLIAIVGLEYLMYKLAIEGKEIYTEKQVTIKVAGSSQQKGKKSSGKGLKASKNKDSVNNFRKGIGERRSEVPVQELPHDDQVQGTELLVDEYEEQGTELMETVMMSLVISKGDFRSKYDVTRDIIKIGRNSGMHCVIQQKSVSSHHATLHSNDGQFFIVDEQSTNKTYVNGKVCTPYQRVVIEPNDHIKLADVDVVLVAE